MGLLGKKVTFHWNARMETNFDSVLLVCHFINIHLFALSFIQKQHCVNQNGKETSIANGYSKLANGTSTNNGNGIKNGISENGHSYLRNRQTAVK